MDFKECKSVKPEKFVVEEFEEEEEEEEEEGTLSLCDLALSSNVSDSDRSSKESESSSFDQDLFEFFTQDLTTSSSTYPKDSIIFCGKLIPYKREKENETGAKKSKTNRRRCFFPRKSYSFNILRSASAKIQGEQTFSKCDFPTKKVPRWYSLAFGAGRYPAEMELKDLKTRQQKLICDGRMRRSMKSPARTKSEKGGKSKRKNNWWGLIRILGCQNRNANAMVKASFGWMPNV